MIPRTTLEIASFWDQEVCLDCETLQPPADEADEMEGDEPACCACGSSSLLPAATILQIADMVGED